MNIIVGTATKETIVPQPDKPYTNPQTGQSTILTGSHLHTITVKGLVNNKGDVKELRIAKFNKSPQPLVTAGTEVQIVYSSTKGKTPGQDGVLPEYHKVEGDIEVLGESPVQDVAPPGLSACAPATAIHTHTKTTSKDVSMEVSGLLQALINTGMYVIQIHATDPIALEVERLEKDLRAALDLKRRVAKDYE